MKNKITKVGFLTLIVAVIFLNSDIAEAKYDWSAYFSKNEIKSIKKEVKKSVRNKLKKPNKKWKGIISGSAIKNNSITMDKIADKVFGYANLDLTGSIKSSDLASNGCNSGQLLKYNGTSWVCGDDDNTGSTLGNTVESSEITDDTIVNADINSSAAIDYSKLNLGANISSLNIADNTITNVDISDSADITASKINFSTNGEHDLGFSTDIIGYGDSKINFSSVNNNTCATGGDCISVGDGKIAVHSRQGATQTDSVEIIQACTDGASYACSSRLDGRPVIRFFEDNFTNILIGARQGRLYIEDGSGDQGSGDLTMDNLHANSAAIGGGSGEYLKFGNTSAGAPPVADCDDDSERGRMSIDTTNNRLYICNGATRGWDYTELTD